MSDPRIALVAEGPTDAIIIEAALAALLTKPFVLTLLQPEATLPAMGSGWGGVLKWCDAFAGRGAAALSVDPLFAHFDLLIVHVDADVTGFRYADLGAATADRATERAWPALPCACACPPASACADAMRARLLAWAGVPSTGPGAILCVPSMAVESWIVAARASAYPRLVPGLECDRELSHRLAQLPKGLRLKKSTRDYRPIAAEVTRAWSAVRATCAQAERFSCEVLAVGL